MSKSISIQVATILGLSLISTATLAQQPVIPGASGFGITTSAGRGGEIYRVTNLDDSGQGSLRKCVEASGPRVCIFEVSGAIKLKSDLVVSEPNLTIAGQTAPAPGVLIRGSALKIRASDVLVQHLELRVGAEQDGTKTDEKQPIKINGVNGLKNVIIDHCSLSWAVDENISTFKSWDNITISNSIISEPLRDARSSTGEHGYSALISNGGSSSKIAFIGNIFAHGHSRNPRSGASDLIFVNNVVYNAGTAAMMLFNKGTPSRNSIVGNMFIDGPNSRATPIRLTGPGDGQGGNALLSGTKVYLSDNVADGMGSGQWSIVDNQSTLSQSALRSTVPVSWPAGLQAIRTSGDEAFDTVLQNAGARPAQRNKVDRRIIKDVKNGTGQVINCVEDDGSSRCAKNAGGWPVVASNFRPLSEPANPNGDSDGDGYTNLEEWLHGMAAEVEGRSGSTQPVASTPMPPMWQN